MPLDNDSKMIPVIGFAGRKSSGKNTLADATAQKLEALGYAPMHVQLAGPIKQFTRDVFGWDLRHTEGELKEVIDPRWGITPRRAMQTLGTEWGRAMHPDLWVECLRAFLRDVRSRNRRVIGLITDVRFANEAAMVIDEGGLVVQVYRPDTAAPRDLHASEDGIPPGLVRLQVYNCGTKAELEAKADAVIRAAQGYGPEVVL